MRRVERIIGLALILIAVACLLEANRLRIYPSRFGIGASTFPFVVGIVNALLGLYFAITAGRAREIHIILPRGNAAKTMLGTMAAMVGYTLALPVLGYAFSTLLASVLLLRAIAKYNWVVSILAGALITGTLYFIFNRLIYISFPTGLIWDI